MKPRGRMLFLRQSILQSIILVATFLLPCSTVQVYSKPLDRDFKRNCAFQLGGHAYNVCALTETTYSVNVEVALPESDNEGGIVSGKKVLSLDIKTWNDEAHSFYDNAAATVSCTQHTWICITEKIHSGHEFIIESTPFMQRDEIHIQLDVARSTLALTHRNGEHTKAIYLQCSERESFHGADHGSEVKYSFVWATPLACPRDFNALADEPEDGVPAEDNEGDDDLMPKQGMTTFRKLVLVALFVVVIPLIIGAFLLSSPRARNFTADKIHGVAAAFLPLISVANVKLRPLGNKINTLNSKLASPFRQGGSKLVVWAQEDMALSDAEDMMVNGSGAYDADGWAPDGLEEYIPLSRDPRHGRQSLVRSYGATSTVETFPEIQEGWASRVRGYFRR